MSTVYNEKEVCKSFQGHYLTFYVGTLSYHATDLTIKGVVEKLFCIKVGKVVVARSSYGK